MNAISKSKLRPEIGKVSQITFFVDFIALHQDEIYRKNSKYKISINRDVLKGKVQNML